MPVRRYIRSLVVRAVEPSVRSWVDTARRDSTEELARLREELAKKPAAPAADERLTKLQEEIDQLKKKLSMAMGAMQAASAQLVQLRQEVESAQNLANQAMQKASSALSTAEAASDGVSALEAASAETTLSAPARSEPSVQPPDATPAPAQGAGPGGNGGKKHRQKRV